MSTKPRLSKQSSNQCSKRRKYKKGASGLLHEKIDCWTWNIIFSSFSRAVKCLNFKFFNYNYQFRLFWDLKCLRWTLKYPRQHKCQRLAQGQIPTRIQNSILSFFQFVSWTKIIPPPHFSFTLNLNFVIIMLERGTLKLLPTHIWSHWATILIRTIVMNL